MPSAQAEGRGVLKFKFSLGYTVSSGQSKPQSETVPNKNNCAVPQACNPSTKEADAGGWQATSRPRLHSEFQIERLCFKNCISSSYTCCAYRSYSVSQACMPNLRHSWHRGDTE